MMLGLGVYGFKGGLTSPKPYSVLSVIRFAKDDV